jgi:hypothetical protein
VSGGKDPARWTATVYRAVVVLVGVALGSRIAWLLLQPLVPTLIALLGLGAGFAVLRGWLRR